MSFNILKPNKTEKLIVTIVISITFGFFIGVLAEKHQTEYKECKHFHDYDNYQCEEMLEHLEIMTTMMENEMLLKDKMEKELEELKK